MINAWDHLENALVNASVAVVTYLVLMTVAHPVKKRLRVPLTFSFHFFAALSAVLMAWFVHRQRGGPYVDLPWMVALHQFFILAWAVLLAVQANKAITRFVWEFRLEQKRRVVVPKLLRDLVAFLLMLAAVLTVAKVVYGQELGTLITASGVVAVVLGFALQNLLGDVIAGIALNIEKPFAVGDWVRVANTDGEVIEINWRATRLRTKEDNYLIIPNGSITKEGITNFNFPNRVHALRANVGVEYGAAPNDVKQVLRQATLRTRGVVRKQEPRVRVTQFGDSSINYEVKFWIDDHASSDDILSDVMTNIWYGLRRARMTIPFPIRDVFMHQPPAAEKEEERRQADARGALRGMELFRPLTDEQIALLAASGRVWRFGRGETVIRKGDAGNSFFLLLSGQASVRVEEEAGDVMGSLKAGDFFGEMSLLTGAPRGATVVADTDLRLVEIGKDALSPVLKENPAVAEAISRLLAERQMANEGFFKQHKPAAEAASTRERYAGSILRGIREFFRL